METSQVRSRPNEAPECVILAGPNGAGKSTIYKNVTFNGVFVNADNVAREMDASNPEGAAIAAGRHVLAELERLIGERADFVYETTLSSHQSVNLIRRVKRFGYKVMLIFVALGSADLHVLRVAQRVRQGGHHIPDENIRRRYRTSFDNLVRSIAHCDEVKVFDNSDEEGPVLVLSLVAGVVAVDNLGHSALGRRIGDLIGLSADHPEEEQGL